MKDVGAKLLKRLEKRNARLQSLVSDQGLYFDALEPGKLRSSAHRRAAADHLIVTFEVSPGRVFAVSGKTWSTQGLARVLSPERWLRV